MRGSGAHLAVRIRSLWKARGPLGFLAFAFSRFARRQSDVLFELRREDCGSPAESPPQGRVIRIDRNNFNDPEVSDILQQVLSGEGEIYRPGLQEQDMLFAVVGEDGTVLHRSFVQYQSRYKRLLGEPESVPLFTNCFTHPMARGMRLYPITLRFASSELVASGAERVIITCDAKNRASVRGIEKAKFRRVAVIESLILMSRLAIQRLHSSGGPVTHRLSRL